MADPDGLSKLASVVTAAHPMDVSAEAGLAAVLLGSLLVLLMSSLLLLLLLLLLFDGRGGAESSKLMLDS